MVEKALIGYLRAISEPKYFSQRNFRPFPTLNFFGGKNEGSFASEVTVNLATGMEPSWCENISVELKGNEPKGLIQLQIRYFFIVGNSCSQIAIQSDGMIHFKT